MAVISAPRASGPGAIAAPRSTKQLVKKEDLLQAAMSSQQAGAVRVVVDALIEGTFSQASVTLHLYEALQALVHTQQVRAEEL